jgi:hypothetical protein
MEQDSSRVKKQNQRNKEIGVCYVLGIISVITMMSGGHMVESLIHWITANMGHNYSI